MTIGSWLTDVENRILGWFSAEDKAIIDFFGPLMAQVKEAALELGKDNLQVGLSIIKDAAIASVVAAATAPQGTQVQVAEATFLKVGATEGIKAIHNAEAGAIKAAVAIIQSNVSPAVGIAVGAIGQKVINDIDDSPSTLINKTLGG